MSAKEAIHANLARLSYAASMRAQAALERAQNRLTVTETARLALTFSLLWFAGNYSYQAALADTEAGVVNVLSASSCLFTLILSALFPSTSMDSLSLTKMVGVLFTIKKQFHMYLFDLWKNYGSIFSFKMGSHLVVVLADAKLMRMAFAKEAFSARPKSELSSILGGYGETSPRS